MYGAYHTLIKFADSKHDIYIENCEQLLIESHQQAWSVFAEAYPADARDLGFLFPIIHFMHIYIGVSSLRTQLQ